MEPKIPNFDFASLYPTTMKVHNIKRPLFRREKIEKLMKIIDDKRTEQEEHNR